MKLFLACLILFVLLGLISFLYCKIRETKHGNKLSSIFLSCIITSFLLYMNYVGRGSNLFYTLSSLSCSVCALLVSVRTIKRIFKKETNDAPEKDTDVMNIARIFVMSCCIFYVFSNPCFHKMIDYHSLYKEPVSVRSYNVILKGYNGKEYTLPARVSIGTVETSDEHYSWNTGEYIESTYDSPAFYVHNIYFSQNQYLYFEDPEEITDIDDFYSSISQDEREWKFKLLNEHVSVPYINEIDNIGFIDCAIYVFVSFASFYQLIYLMKRTNEDDESKKL